MIEKANLRAALGNACGEERPVQDARMAVGIEDEGGVLVRERRDGAEHGLVAGRERQAGLEAHPGRESLLELDVLAGGSLRTRRREPASIDVDRTVGGFLHLWMIRQAEVVVRAEVGDRLAGDRRVKPACLELSKEGIDLPLLARSDACELRVRLYFDPA